MARANYDQQSASARAQEIEISNAEVQLMRDETSLKSAQAELEKSQFDFRERKPDSNASSNSVKKAHIAR